MDLHVIITQLMYKYKYWVIMHKGMVDLKNYIKEIEHSVENLYIQKYISWESI